mmetsp:Transcript_15483/g.42745  ORF Transcript_15483/g.42745 Transcript_15483/m.42745 type:complete len:211 (-) Transcript_15483:607-1239(-)
MRLTDPLKEPPHQSHLLLGTRSDSDGTELDCRMRAQEEQGQDIIWIASFHVEDVRRALLAFRLQGRRRSSLGACCCRCALKRVIGTGILGRLRLRQRHLGRRYHRALLLLLILTIPPSLPPSGFLARWNLWRWQLCTLVPALLTLRRRLFHRSAILAAIGLLACLERYRLIGKAFKSVTNREDGTVLSHHQGPELNRIRAPLFAIELSDA